MSRRQVEHQAIEPDQEPKGCRILLELNYLSSFGVERQVDSYVVDNRKSGWCDNDRLLPNNTGQVCTPRAPDCVFMRFSHGTARKHL